MNDDPDPPRIARCRRDNDRRTLTPTEQAEDAAVQAEIERRATGSGRQGRRTTGSEYRGWRERQARGEDPYDTGR